MTECPSVTPKPTRYKIVIVDDHPIVRHGLVELISHEPDVEVCGEAGNVPDALRQVEVTHPDMAIVDPSFEGDIGIQLIQQIRTLYPEVKVLVLSIHDEMSIAPRLLRAGALGYVNKRESIHRVIEAMRQVLHDEICVSPRVADRLLRRAALGEPVDRDPTESLTNRELEVFEMVGRGLETQQIANKLRLSPKTIETHRKNIKIKLELQNSAQLNRRAFLWVREHH